MTNVPGCLPAKTPTRENAFTSTVSVTGSNDPIPGRYALAEYHFNRCEKDGLDQDTLPGLKLYDDGSHGDSIANDGMYGLSYANTDLEGSYTFRFHVRGTTSDGLKFSRTRMLSQFVGILPDEDNSEVTSLSGSVIDGWQVLSVYFLPRDQKGNYVGPGFAHRYKVTIQGGNLDGSLQDLNNGTYLQQVRYSENGRKPTVTFVDEEGGFEKIVNLGGGVYELVPFVGISFFDSALGLDDNIVFGGRFNVALLKQLYLEAEVGITLTETTSGNSGNMIQTLLSARYDITTANTRYGQLTPYVSAGAGYVFFRGFGNDDEAFAYQGSVGATLKLNNSFGLRLDGRVLQVDNVMGSGSTTNSQATLGLVFSF